MVIKNFVDVTAGSRPEVTVDGIKYQFAIENFECKGGYCPILIIDTSDNSVHQSYGSLELNGHVFNTRWKYEYDYNRSNYVASHELIVEVI